MTDTTPDTTPDIDEHDDGQWHTTTSAAAKLGVTERTLQRRVAAKRYRVERNEGKVRVWLPTHVGQLPDTARQESDNVAELSATVGQALAMLARKRERAATAETRASQAEQAAAMW